MKKWFQYVMTGFLLFIALLTVNPEKAAAKEKVITERGVTYTYEFVGKSRHMIRIIHADNVPDKFTLPSRLGQYKVREVGKSAFCHCGIRELVIGRVNLKKIGRFAFAGNIELQKVTFKSNSKDIYIGRDWFTDCPYVRIVIPQSAEEAVIRVNANSGSLVLEGSNTRLRGVKKIPNRGYYLQFKSVEVPSSSKALKVLEKAYYGVVDDTSEERYDSDSNDYSNSILKRVKVLDAGSARINIRYMQLRKGEKRILRILKKNGKLVKWHSSDNEVASVNKAGEVKAKKAGRTMISAKCGKKKFCCKVIVSAGIDANQISIIYNNMVFTEQIFNDNLRRITRADSGAVVKTPVGVKQIYAQLALLCLEKLPQPPDETETGESFLLHLEWDSGEKTIAIYKGGYIGVEKKGFYKTSQNVYRKIKQLIKQSAE